MRRAHRMRWLLLFLLGFKLALWAGEPEQSRVRGVWLGQDGHDYCQTSSALGPNDIQDLHIRLEGLPADAEIDSLLVTRLGGGAWSIKGLWHHWQGRLLQEPHGTTADLFLEPSHQEQQCRLDCELHYADGKVARFSVAGGPSNPNLFMPGARLAATWVGQEGHDWTGLTPSVGPDGFEDARVDVSGLSTKVEIKSLTIECPDGAGWEYGLNPRRRWNAELVREPKDHSHGGLFFSPDRDLGGTPLQLRVTYANDRSSTFALTAGRTEPGRRMPPPPEISIRQAQLTIRWLGQDGSTVTGPGDVHLAVQGLPAKSAIAAAALSDWYGGYWLYRRDDKVKFYPPAHADTPPSLPMLLRQTNEGAVELFFPPSRDETDTPMVLRLVLEDGTTLVNSFSGRSCDPFRRGPRPTLETAEAKPGDDLNVLAEKFGTIRLAPGRYTLGRPLKLARPITLTGPRSAVLFFTQTADEPAWSGAVLIGASHVTLAGFSLRFADGFRWAVDKPGGAALLRSFDPPGRADPKVGVVLSSLDIESSTVPPPKDPRHPPEAPYLTRLAGATSGLIISNRFRGGTVDVANGPWRIAHNEHRGAMPGTVAWDAFGGHWLQDFVLENNRVHDESPGGKTWRFISMNQLGQKIVIRDNDVSGVGMRDDDQIPNPNAPEILLTESYRLYYEGKPAAISNGGRVLQIPFVMYDAVRAGSIVSILSGEHAGRYFRIAQPLSAAAFLMAEPLPAGDYAISIAHGYVDGLLERNRIDARGGASAIVVLAGNHWGFKMLDNQLVGGGESLRLQSTPTEAPNIWGWSHTPFLGLVCQGNTFEDSRRGVALDVHSNQYNKSFAGRTYLAGAFRNNIIRWTPQKPRPSDPAPIRIGDSSGEDPAQMILTVEGNSLSDSSGEPSRAALSIHHATINGQPVQESSEGLSSKNVLINRQ